MECPLLTCPKCLQERCITLRPWATAEGVFGAISVLCNACDWIGILSLDQAHTFAEA